MMDVPDPDLTAFAAAVTRGDAEALRGVLESSAAARARVNAPCFAFGGRALHVAANRPAVVDVLLEFGADLHLRSEWANGPFTVLDHAADEAAARFLLSRGAELTPHVAARLGWFDELKALVERDPLAVRQRGGDGQQPLHQAATVQIAEYLLDHGAGIDVRCIDHRSTPAQYAVASRPDVCRVLLARGAAPDIFMAAVLGDAGLAGRLLDEDPNCAAARINEPGYAPVPPSHIYCWTLGFLRTPHDLAAELGHTAVYDLLMRRSSPRVRLLALVTRADEEGARAVIAEHPGVVAQLTPGDHAQLAQAIFHGRSAAAALMLRLGFDPLARGTDGGTALHMACWMGDVGLVDALLARGVPLDDRDPTHCSTPLGWAEFGAEHRSAPGGDYAAVIQRLRAAGANA